MDLGRRQYVLADPIDQRTRQPTGRAHPVSKCGAIPIEVRRRSPKLQRVLAAL